MVLFCFLLKVECQFRIRGCYCENPHRLQGLVPLHNRHSSLLLVHGVLSKTPNDTRVDQYDLEPNIVPVQTHRQASQDLLKAHLIRCVNAAFGYKALEVVDEEDLLSS